MPQSDIKLFIDFFHDAVPRIRRSPARFIRGKDGKLVQQALAIFTRTQLEMLALWFLSKKQKLSPTIGAMLSKKVMEELSRIIQKPSFWKELDQIAETYYPRKNYQTMLKQETRLFSKATLQRYHNQQTS